MSSVKKQRDRFTIYIYGPTAVGKTEFVDLLANELPSEIVNCDMGQLYVPLTIGTAKPDWRSASVPHRLFDVIDEPRSITVVEYRAMLMREIQRIHDAGKIPLVVGGSSFYVRSVFYPPQEHGDVATDDVEEISWDRLYEVDPERALKIGKNDVYRIKRALSLWKSTGMKPSALKPVYAPPGNYVFINLSRDRRELYQRIDERVVQMLDAGWIDEVRRLMGTPWEPWLIQKKIIGYDDIINYLRGGDAGDQSYQDLVARIQKRTRNYAKRQMSFGRMLERQLNSSLKVDSVCKGHIAQVNLTGTNPAVYSKQIKNELAAF